MKVFGQETCPQCKSVFNTRSAIVSFGQKHMLSNTPAIPPLVSCPNCRFEFESTGMRYFGFLSPSVFKACLMFLLPAMFLLAIVISAR
jgi:hypothetical protein